jgi:hypothetical protein
MSLIIILIYGIDRFLDSLFNYEEVAQTCA